MFTTVSNHAFVDAFRGSNTYGDNFSYNGLNTLFDIIEEYEESIGEEIELDIVALCCGYSEYASLRDVASNYASEFKDTIEEMEKDGEDEESIDDYIREKLGNNTTFVEFTGGVIVQYF